MWNFIGIASGHGSLVDDSFRFWGKYANVKKKKEKKENRCDLAIQRVTQ